MIALFLFLMSLISVPMVIVLSILGLIGDSKHCKTYSLFLALAMGIIAYNFNPIGHPDLVRYFEIIGYAKNTSLTDYFKLIGDNLFVTNTAFWIAGNMDKPHLIPAISTFIVYFTAFSISADYAMLVRKEKHVWKVILIQFLCLNYSSIFMNVRNICAFAIVIFAVYLELIRNKPILSVVYLYIIACFIHESGTILVAIRFLIYFFRNNIIFGVILSALIPTAINYLGPNYLLFRRYGALGNILSNLILTSYRAMYSTSTWANTVMTSMRHLADRYLSIVLCAVLLYCVYRLVKLHLFNKYFYYLGLLCLMTIVCNVFRTPAYWRLFSASIICGGPLLLLIVHKRLFISMDPGTATIFILGLSLMLFGIHFYGSLSEINYKDLFIQTLIKPLAYVIYDISIGFLNLIN